MPIYEYQCRSCSTRFELRRHFDDPVDAACPHCSTEARRLFSPVPIVFKGPGFYVTDKAAEDKKSKACGASSSQDKDE